MDYQTYTNHLLDVFNKAFSSYFISIRKDHDDSRCLFVAIYGVPESAVDSVESAAYDIIKSAIIPFSTDFMVIPEVVDEITTDRYYPDMAGKVATVVDSICYVDDNRLWLPPADETKSFVLPGVMQKNYSVIAAGLLEGDDDASRFELAA